MHGFRAVMLASVAAAIVAVGAGCTGTLFGGHDGGPAPTEAIVPFRVVAQGPYEVWQGNTEFEGPDWYVQLYNLDQHDFHHVGTATADQTFIVGDYHYVTVTTRAEVLIDAVQMPNGEWLLDPSDYDAERWNFLLNWSGNINAWPSPSDPPVTAVCGAPDGVSVPLGSAEYSTGGTFRGVMLLRNFCYTPQPVDQLTVRLGGPGGDREALAWTLLTAVAQDTPRAARNTQASKADRQLGKHEESTR